MAYIIDDDLCTLCQCCEDRCPVDAIDIHSSVKVDPNECLNCACCASVCPTGAIHRE